MNAYILEEPPLSGTYEEYVFGNLTSKKTWVLFTDKEYNEWVGVFDKDGFFGVDLVIDTGNKNIALVISCGKGYFIEINQRKLICKTELDDIKDGVYNENTNQIIVTDGLYIFILNKEQIVWKSNRISLDGICFNEVKGNIIKGKLNGLSSEGIPFVFDTETKNIKSDFIFDRDVSFD